MRVTFYSAVLLAAVCSVIFGLDWASAPMLPMPEAKNIVFVPPPPPPPPPPSPPPPRVAAPVTPAPATNQPVPQTPPAPQTAAAPVAAPPVPIAPPVVAASKVKCDIDACAAAYRSFRDSDCTYNPSFGPRRLCTKGDPERYAREHPEVTTLAAPSAPPLTPAPEAPPVAQATELGSIMAPEPGTTPTAAGAPPRCNVAACAATYPRSFREADCTFNPSTGPRRVCEK